MTFKVLIYGFLLYTLFFKSTNIELQQLESDQMKQTKTKFVSI